MFVSEMQKEEIMDWFMESTEDNIRNKIKILNIEKEEKCIR